MKNPTKEKDEFGNFKPITWEDDAQISETLYNFNARYSDTWKAEDLLKDADNNASRIISDIKETIKIQKDKAIHITPVYLGRRELAKDNITYFTFSYQDHKYNDEGVVVTDDINDEDAINDILKQHLENPYDEEREYGNKLPTIEYHTNNKIVKPGERIYFRGARSIFEFTEDDIGAFKSQLIEDGIVPLSHKIKQEIKSFKELVEKVKQERTNIVNRIKQTQEKYNDSMDNRE